MKFREMTAEETYEVEVRLLKGAAARYGGLMDRDRERRRAAARRAREIVTDGAREGTAWGRRQ